MSEPDVDHYRYRALLKAADDEPKRLALIQLLIREGARDKLAAKSKVAGPETPLPQPRPFMLPVPTAEALPQEATPSNECERLGESDILDRRRCFNEVCGLNRTAKPKST